MTLNKANHVESVEELVKGRSDSIVGKSTPSLVPRAVINGNVIRRVVSSHVAKSSAILRIGIEARNSSLYQQVDILSEGGLVGGVIANRRIGLNPPKLRH